LFVDDVLLNIKILCLKLLKQLNPNYKYDNFPILTNEQWQQSGIFIVEYNIYAFIFASNGLYGNDIALSIKCDLIITDIQMPLMNGIDMIKSLITNSCKSKIFVNTALSRKELDESTELIEILTNKQIKFLEKGSNIDFSTLII
jgi:CheY-like chemotaxis protein